MEDTEEILRDSLWRTLQTVSDWIRVADAKAGAALAIDGVILAIITARLRAAPAPTSPVVIGASATIAVAAFSGLLAIWTVVPRTRWLRANSLVHYGTIASFDTAADYHEVAVTRFVDPSSLTEALTAHIWTISRSAVRKYRLVTLAIQFLAVAMVLGLTTLLL